MRNCIRVNWSIRRDIKKKLDLMKEEAEKTSTTRKVVSYGMIITAMVDKNFKDPEILLNEIKQDKRILAKKMSLLIEKENKLIQQITGIHVP